MNKKPIIIVAVILSIIGSGFAGWNLNSRMQNKSLTDADNFAADVSLALISGNYIKAYRSTSQSYKDEVSEEQFAEITKSIIDLPDDSEIIDSTKTQGDGTYAVTQTIPYTDEDSRYVAYTLVEDQTTGKLAVDTLLVQ